MGFKAFFDKIHKAQDVLKVLVNASHDIPTSNNNTYSNDSSSSPDHERSSPPWLHVRQGLVSSATKVDVEVFAREISTTSSTVGSSLLRRKLRKAAPVLKDNSRHLSAKQALERIHATSPFVSSPRVSKIPPSVQIHWQQAMDMNEAVSEQVSQNEPLSESASPKSLFTEASADLTASNTPVSSSSSPTSIEQQKNGDFFNTIEEPSVWVSDAAYAVLDPSPVSYLPPRDGGRHQSNHTPGLRSNISTEQSDDHTSINSSLSSERTSSSREAAEGSTPFTPAETDCSCARSRRYVLLDPVFEDQGHDEVPPQPGLESPCPLPRPATAVTKRTTHTPSVAESHSHRFQFHVHASLAPVYEDTRQDDQPKELQLLQEDLDHRDKLNQALRLQLLETEDEVANLNEQLQSLQKERDMFEAEQDASSEQLRTVQQQLVTMGRAVAEADAKMVAARRELQVDQSSLNSRSTHLISELNSARDAAKAQFHRAQHFIAIANAAAAERDKLSQHLAHMQAVAQQSTQQHQTEVLQLRDSIEHARVTVEWLEQRIGDLTGQKEKADERVEKLEVRVQSLLQDVTAKWIEEPMDHAEEVVGSTLKPNELRDLRQAFEMSQARLEAAADVNQELHTDAERREKELEELRENNDLLKAKAARLSSTFEIWMTKLENWSQTIPGIAKVQDSIEDVPGLKELLEESIFHEQSVAKELKDKADLVSDLEATALKLKHEHCHKIEDLNQRVEVLQEENIRHDARNFELTDHLHESQQELEKLKEELAQKEDEVQQWKTQCLEQAFGDTARVINRHHEMQLKQYSDLNEALMQRCDRSYIVQSTAESELAQFRWQVAEKLAGVAELGAERDWYRLQVEGLRERFQHELLVEPFEIPYAPAYSLLSPEDKEAMILGQDHVIGRLTGALPVRADVTPRNIQVIDLWAGFVAWFNGEGNADGKEAQKADPKLEAPAMVPMGASRRLQSSHDLVDGRSLDGGEGSSWVTDDGSETTRSSYQEPTKSIE